VRPQGERSSLVSIREDAVAGPGKLVPKPLRQAVILPRNREALRRLALLAEGRAQPRIDRSGARGVGPDAADGTVPQAPSSPSDPALPPDQPTNSA
jgi:hypothetical protein